MRDALIAQLVIAEAISTWFAWYLFKFEPDEGTYKNYRIMALACWLLFSVSNAYAFIRLMFCI